MKRLFTAIATICTLAACGPTPQSVCDDQAAAFCEKMWGCEGSQGLKIGSDQATCVTQSQALCSLATSGTYDLAKEEQCTAALKAQTCEQYKTAQPSSCNND